MRTLFAGFVSMLGTSMCLSACNSSDPRQDGLYGSVHALRNGAYESRIQQRQQQLSQLHQQQDQQQRQINALRQKSLKEQQRVQSLTTAMRTEQLRKQQQREKIRALNIRQQVLRKQLHELDAAMQALDRLAASQQSDNHEQSKNIQLLIKERDRLRQQLKSLLEKSI